ncbi:hypothetical protein DB88DRAFT_518000 [Papiliotrema laurentii]|uniref:Uncharacterized protein n=1 Tax=Papiliotrema laurentii TaxID=5418 RepID=A0AAD9FN76_PAPLA|nr:hypothetical protein DB88DRAFT_518000 [Papiliotrema laurentii]
MQDSGRGNQFVNVTNAGSSGSGSRYIPILPDVPSSVLPDIHPGLVPARLPDDLPLPDKNSTEQSGWQYFDPIQDTFVDTINMVTPLASGMSSTSHADAHTEHEGEQYGDYGMGFYRLVDLLRRTRAGENGQPMLYTPEIQQNLRICEQAYNRYHLSPDEISGPGHAAGTLHQMLRSVSAIKKYVDTYGDNIDRELDSIIKRGVHTIESLNKYPTRLPASRTSDRRPSPAETSSARTREGDTKLAPAEEQSQDPFRAFKDYIKDFPTGNDGHPKYIIPTLHGRFQTLLEVWEPIHHGRSETNVEHVTQITQQVSAINEDLTRYRKTMQSELRAIWEQAQRIDNLLRSSFAQSS